MAGERVTGRARVRRAARGSRLRERGGGRITAAQVLAVAVSILGLSFIGGMLVPTEPSPPLGVVGASAARDRLAALGAALDAGLAAHGEMTLSLGQAELAVLLADLADLPGGSDSLWVRVAPQTVTVWLRAAGPLGSRAVLSLRIQPSLLDGLLFCGLRSVRVGVCPFPVAWLVRPPGGSAGAGWGLSRGAVGYHLPTRFLRGQTRVELAEIWLGEGVVEVTLRKVETRDGGP